MPQTAHPRASRASITFGHRNLPLLLLQTRESVLARFRPLLNEAGITEQQWRIVRALLDTGPLEPRQIVTLCGISSPSLAGVLARMDDLGLVQRDKVDHDARRLLVSLTPKSRALARRLAPRIAATYAELESLAGADLIAGLYQTLDLLGQKLGAGADPAAPVAPPDLAGPADTADDTKARAASRQPASPAPSTAPAARRAARRR